MLRRNRHYRYSVVLGNPIGLGVTIRLSIEIFLIYVCSTCLIIFHLGQDKTVCKTCDQSDSYLEDGKSLLVIVTIQEQR